MVRGNGTKADATPRGMVPAIALAIGLFITTIGAQAATAAPPVTGGDRAGYVVRLVDGADKHAVAAAHHVSTGQEYSAALNGFSASLTASEAAGLETDPAVEVVVADTVVRAATEQDDAPWNLDRIDQQRIPLDGIYRYVTTGTGVTAYVIDSGIRSDHAEFGGRAVTGKKGFDAFDALGLGAGTKGEDCAGHGTHVAGTIGGATYGVAKAVKLVSVRVLDCDNAGTLSTALAGIDWVAAHAVKPAVVNMSIEGTWSAQTNVLNDAVASVIANNGIPFVVAAGNDDGDACRTTPASTPTAITVGATEIGPVPQLADQDGNGDVIAAFSNKGPCVDVYAPGVNIESAGITSSTATTTMSGTSMASPLVAGMAALFLERDPAATAATVHEAIVDSRAWSAQAADGSLGAIPIKFTGHLAGTGATATVPFGYTPKWISGNQRILLAGPAKSNFNLALSKLDLSLGWVPLLSATTSKSTESIAFRGEFATYKLDVTSVNGGGDYELWWQHPDQ